MALTPNGVLFMNADVGLKLLLQVVKVIQMGNAQIRVVLSDGVNLQEAQLKTQMNEKVKNGLVVKGSIVELVEYKCHSNRNLKSFTVLKMEVVEPKAKIIGHAKYLNAGGEQQTAGPSPGPGGVQQLLARVFAPPSVADAAKSGNVFRSVGKGLGQTLGTGIDNGTGGFSMGQVRSGGFSPYPSTGVGVKFEPVVSKGTTGNGAGVGNGQQQNTFVRPMADYKRALVYGKQGSIEPCYDALVYGKHGSIKPCYDEDSSLTKLIFDFRPISEVHTLKNNAVIDLIGVVVSINPTITVYKNGSETQKRTLELKDRSGKDIRLTMWGDFCKKEGQELQHLCDAGAYPILAVNGGRLNEYMCDKVISTLSSTKLFIDPKHPESVALQSWFNADSSSKIDQSKSVGDHWGGEGGNRQRKTVGRQRAKYGTGTCYSCGLRGHFSRDCLQHKRDSSNSGGD